MEKKKCNSREKTPLPNKAKKSKSKVFFLSLSISQSQRRVAFLPFRPAGAACLNVWFERAARASSPSSSLSRAVVRTCSTSFPVLWHDWCYWAVPAVSLSFALQVCRPRASMSVGRSADLVLSPASCILHPSCSTAGRWRSCFSGCVANFL